MKLLRLVALVDRQCPPWVVVAFHRGMVSGTLRFDEGDHGWYQRPLDGWSVEVEPANENKPEGGWWQTLTEWGDDPRHALIRMAVRLRRYRNPHIFHVEQGDIEADCDGCARDRVELDLPADFVGSIR